MSTKPPSTALSTFLFNSQTIRVVTIEGNPWFVAADVRSILNIQQGGKNYATLDTAEMTMRDRASLGMKPGRPVVLISESGLYKLVLRSDKPEAKPFQDWVTKVVLPAIRKDGAYVSGEEKVASGELSEDEFLLKAFGILQKKVERLTTERDALQQTVDVKINNVTVDAYRAHLGAYWPHGTKTKMGQLAAALAADRGIILGKEDRTLIIRTSEGRRKQVVTSVHVYPIELLDEVRTILEI